MITEPYFIWNGVDSRTMGVIVTDVAPLVFPAERVEEIVVPGRPGALVRDEGEGIFDSYALTIGIANRSTVPMGQIAAWLRGAGELILSTEPDRVYQARIIRQASTAYAFRTSYNGAVNFQVQPLKAAYPPVPPIVFDGDGEGSDEITHQGDVPARPVYTLVGAGELILDVGDASEGGAGSRIVVDVGEEGDGCVIDTDAGTVTNLDGTESLTASTQLYYNGFRGLWLPAGTTPIAWGANVDTVTVDPRWRWL